MRFQAFKLIDIERLLCKFLQDSKTYRFLHALIVTNPNFMVKLLNFLIYFSRSLINFLFTLPLITR